jgi:hypothetical protein
MPPSILVTPFVKEPIAYFSLATISINISGKLIVAPLSRQSCKYASALFMRFFKHEAAEPA